MEANQELYIGVGGKGTSDCTATSVLGGYNGGGACGPTSATYNGAGGGATHIATTNRGIFSQYVSNKDEILIVAGGGGGASNYNAGGTSHPGGAGGGTTGIDGHYVSSLPTYNGKGGTQLAGGAGENCAAGSFGQGGSKTTSAAGGGGGYFGGGCGWGSSGGGGSGYIGGVTSSTTYNVTASTIDGTLSMPSISGGTETGHTGNGYAKITYLGT